jgi:hypothetical protein
MANRIYGGLRIDMEGAIDVHIHTFPDVIPRLADDLEVARAARDAGMAAVMLKSPHESTVSRAYLTGRVVPGIRVYGGIVLNRAVGGVNPAAVETWLRLGAKQVWMPTIDADFHAQVYGGTGRYDMQTSGASEAAGISVLNEAGELTDDVEEVLSLIAEHDIILGTCHLSPEEIYRLVKRARQIGIERILLTHPYFKTPGLDMVQVIELADMGATPEFGYCTVSPAWHYVTPELVAETIRRVGASRCVLMSDVGQRHNPLPHEALRVFAQTIYEKGIPYEDVRRMIVDRPRELLGIGNGPPRSDADGFAWPAELEEQITPPVRMEVDGVALAGDADLGT